VIYDRFGRYPDFVEHFHKMFARSQNALRGRWENLWSSDRDFGHRGIEAAFDVR
jgi:hypothetical protein